jgi:hypothetical protein
MMEMHERDEKAMGLLIDKGIIAEGVTLRDLAHVASDLSKMGNPDEVADWTFVGPHYIYKGDKISELNGDLRSQ